MRRKRETYKKPKLDRKETQRLKRLRKAGVTYKKLGIIFRVSPSTARNYFFNYTRPL